jgi:hypothetical protein
VLVLPALGPENPKPGSSLWPQEIGQCLLQDFPGAGLLDAVDLLAPLRRALQRLEAAGLVYSTYHQRSPVWHITELGEQALGDGSVERRIAEAT